ncbi:enoyl-CoA hydratase/isomerase family protein [Janibacter sp. G1551]|uniref:enoyl-CoA hydratase/isomerase family protein n=1 Tax=Janibacter sp. G1551 TaxID=3420440 RepID=UPI003D014976
MRVSEAAGIGSAYRLVRGWVFALIVALPLDEGTPDDVVRRPTQRSLAASDDKAKPTMTDADDAAREARDEILLGVTNAVATITLNRPSRKNAMTTASWARLGEVVREVRDDASVRAVVLTGAGSDFCTGTDLGGTPDPWHPLVRMGGFSDIAVALYEMPKPVVARIDGAAVGAGCNLALFPWGTRSSDWPSRRTSAHT